ncbi:hypothetical protein QTP86_022084 [Hemibagrus guttatus]|nr:hypothetical protein QTP86_022084 [Hemibagrus guttatus]
MGWQLRGIFLGENLLKIIDFWWDLNGLGRIQTFNVGASTGLNDSLGKPYSRHVDQDVAQQQSSGCRHSARRANVRYCSSLVEFVTARCRPFYLPREFTTVFTHTVGVYIPPSANAKEALCELYRPISELQNAHPDGLFIIAGDVNHANLKSVLPKFHQYVDFATRGVKVLDLVYTNIPGVYCAEPAPHLGYSDHISVLLVPAYRPLVRHSKPVRNWLKPCQKEPSLHFRTVLSALTGTCSGRLQPMSITNYRPAPPACDSDASLPDALNIFSARFEAQNDVTARKTIPLCRVNPRKPAGPDNIPGRVLRECAEQLADVFTDIFNISLGSAVVLTCLKTTTIIPIPKKSPVSRLNDYHPVALAPIIMKCFEKLVMRQIKDLLPPSLDFMQFAYHPNRSMDDALSTALHLSLAHLENKDTRMNAVHRLHFSIQHDHPSEPDREPEPAGHQHLPLQLNPGLSDWETSGCVLIPLLFTLLTHDCAAMHSSNHIIKFADDTIMVGLISKNDESADREEVQRLTSWCKDNNLSLNVEKTKEMVVDFRRAQSEHSPLNINGSNVEIVKSTKFLCVHLADDLTWSLNTSSITKKAQQRLYFLRRLRKAHLPLLILTTFYRGTIKSILSSCITVWFGNCTASDRKSLQQIMRTAEKIIGVSLPSITDMYTVHCIRKAKRIVDDPTHLSHTLFTLLPSRKRANRKLQPSP